MNRQALALTALAASLLLLWPTIGHAKPKPKKPTPHSTTVSAPQQAALSWLALTDAAKYAESWDAASPQPHTEVTRDKWANIVRPVRDPMGQVKSRTLKSGQHTPSLPNAPLGDYAVLIYTTTFAKQGVMQETVILNHDNDGKWRVSGYYVKPAA